MQTAIFKYRSIETDQIKDLTTIEIDGEVWFVAPEVCNLLGLVNVTEALRPLDDDEKLTSELLRAGQKRKVNLVNESGLYSLIFKSQKETAKKFKKWITKEVIPSIRKTGSYSVEKKAISHNFVVRFNENWERTDKGHFSVISELFMRLYGKFEMIGYNIPNKALGGKEMRPDNSVGLLFSKYLTANHPEKAKDFKMYSHLFPDGSEFEARQYKNELLPIFITFVETDWLPNRAPQYFKERDPIALDYLPKLLGM